MLVHGLPVGNLSLAKEMMDEERNLINDATSRLHVGAVLLGSDILIKEGDTVTRTKRIAQVLPGVCDTRTTEEGGTPNFWAGLRPATPTNIPYIGKTRVAGLWVNAGHGTLGWTHACGSGKSIARIVSGLKPEVDFAFAGA